jgi:hypothetical protein
MKNIVTISRSITEDVEAQEETLFTETKNSLYELKTRFSTSLSDLLVAAKYHASGMGISPVSLLDRSAGHLTSVIVDLVKLLGMHPTNELPPTPTDRQSTNTKRPETNKSSYYGSIISRKSSTNHKSTVSTSHYEDVKQPRSQLDSMGYSSKQQHQQQFQQRKNSHNDDLTPEELVVSVIFIIYEPQWKINIIFLL